MPIHVHSCKYIFSSFMLHTDMHVCMSPCVLVVIAALYNSPIALLLFNYNCSVIHDNYAIKSLIKSDWCGGIVGDKFIKLSL